MFYQVHYCSCHNMVPVKSPIVFIITLAEATESKCPLSFLVGNGLFSVGSQITISFLKFFILVFKCFHTSFYKPCFCIKLVSQTALGLLGGTALWLMGRMSRLGLVDHTALGLAGQMAPWVVAMNGT